MTTNVFTRQRTAHWEQPAMLPAAVCMDNWNSSGSSNSSSGSSRLVLAPVLSWLDVFERPRSNV
eukprot:2145796-Rhodomonas_salina.1